VQQAIADGAPWVLKPQREGGGNNLYGAELSAFLKEHQGDPVLSGAYPTFGCDLHQGRHSPHRSLPSSTQVMC
jgi:hypothetical protein